MYLLDVSIRDLKYFCVLFVLFVFLFMLLALLRCYTSIFDGFITIVIISPVIWIVMSNARMRSVTNYFIINLSMADIINATFNVVPNFTYMLTGNWPFGEILYDFASNAECFLS